MADNAPVQATGTRSKKLNTKDLIYAGVFYVLYIIAAFCNAAGNAKAARAAGNAPSMA